MESVHEQGKPVVFALNVQSLEKNKKRVAAKDPSIMAAYKMLIKDADKALQFGPVSVMEKKNDPPSGDKHDYMSLAPYFWPDPNKPGGLPYIRRDGETNPEVKEYKDKEYQPLYVQMCKHWLLPIISPEKKFMQSMQQNYYEFGS
jgi:hypothetical protein